MERLLDLDELSARIAAVDGTIMRLVERRMHLAALVGKFKLTREMPIFRGDKENQRINDVRMLAERFGISPHLAETITYALINESCKLQMIQLQMEIARLKKQGPGPHRPETDDQWYALLKRNLLILTERWCATYDEDYENSYFGTQKYLEYELELLSREISELPDTELMLDLGCATGRMAFQFNRAFARIIGYDISQHMQARANQLAEVRNLQSKLVFECADLEDGIPMPDATVSFVVMNLGTAGDMRDIGKVIDETLRVLKPGGRFFFSFYNRDALVYRWELLPWQTGLAAMVNIHGDSLDVHLKTDDDAKEQIISVYARAYTRDEVSALFANRGINVSPVTYPTMSAILPNELLTSQADIQESVVTIERALVDTSLGAYVIARGEKPR